MTFSSPSSWGDDVAAARLSISLGLGIRTAEGCIPKAGCRIRPPAATGCSPIPGFPCAGCCKECTRQRSGKGSCSKILNRFTLFAQEVCFRSKGGSLCCFRPECGNFAFSFIHLELQSPQFLFGWLAASDRSLAVLPGSLQLFLLFSQGDRPSAARKHAHTN